MNERNTHMIPIAGSVNTGRLMGIKNHRDIVTLNVWMNLTDCTHHQYNSLRSDLSSVLKLLLFIWHALNFREKATPAGGTDDTHTHQDNTDTANRSCLLVVCYSNNKCKLKSGCFYTCDEHLTCTGVMHWHLTFNQMIPD